MDNVYKPRKIEGHTYIMCGKTFQLYSLDKFDFESPLYVGKGKGVYSFTQRVNPTNAVHKNDRMEMIYNHSLIYLGKSDKLEERLHSHDGFKEIRKCKADVIGVYFCTDDEDPKAVESSILAEYFFKLNIAENADPKGKKTIVAEE